MGAVIFAIFYLIALGFWLWLVGFVGSIIAVAAGGAFAFWYCAIYMKILGQVMAARHSTLSPPIKHQPSTSPAKGEKPAYRHYFSGQAWVDLRHVLSKAKDECVATFARAARRVNELWFNPDHHAAVWPFMWAAGIVSWVGLLLGIAGGTLLVLVAAAIHVMVVGLSLVMAWTAIGLLRLLDTALLRSKGIRISCPSCFKRVNYPSYDCPSATCTIRHGDVRPGRYGVLRRTCVCGTQMPTLILLGSYKLEAFCPACTKPLVSRAGTAAEIILPVFGATAAGKTRLMLAITTALDELAAEHGAVVSAADNETQREYNKLKPVLVRGEDTPRTTIALSRALSFYVAPASGARRLYRVFDAAGERFDTSERLQELQYLAIARSFILVIDLLSVNAFWDSLTKNEQERLTSVRLTFRQPEFVFQQTLQNIEVMGGTTKRGRLAVALSKADLVRGVSVLDGVEQNSDSIKALLDDRLGLGNMLRVMQQSFGRVKFFFTAAVVNQCGAVDPSIRPLINWLLRGENLQLEPAATATAIEVNS